MKRTPEIDQPDGRCSRFHRSWPAKQVRTSILLLALLPSALLITACVGRKPVAELARADHAIHHAQTTSQAATYAPAELASAQAKLASARRAMAAGDYADARDLADQARAYAELAEEKAESQDARAAASSTLAEVEVLRADTTTEPDTVIVERRTVTRTSPSTVVIERPAVTTVDHPVTAPVEVTVERPRPAAGAVPYEPPVIVVPE